MKKTPLLFIVLLITAIFSCPVHAQEAPPPPAQEETTAPPAPSWEDGPELPGGGGGRFLQEFLHMMLSLGFILAVILVVAWLLKRVMRQRLETMNQTALVRVLERRALTAKSAVYLLEVMGRGILVGESPTGLQRLSEFPLPPNDDSTQEKSFGDVYKQKTEKKRKSNE